MTLPDATPDAAAAMVAGDWFHYPDSAIPHPTDDAAAVVVRAFAGARDAEERAIVLSLLGGRHVYVLRNFAVRMAALAVRRRSVDDLRTALHAIALTGSSPESDWRDLGIALIPLTDAARRISAGERVFEEAARLAVGRTAQLIRDAAPKVTLLGLLERLIGLFVKGPWAAVHAPDGFRYVSTGTAPDPEAFLRQIEEARRLAAGRFRVSDIFDVPRPRRGRAVFGEILDGRIKVGHVVRAAHLDPATEWRVIGIEFADSPPTRDWKLALVLADARPLEETRRLLPPGSELVWGPEQGT